MNVIYNSAYYYVVEYPDHEGYEIVLKSLRLSAYLHHDAGDAFCAAFSKVAAADSSAEACDGFLNELHSLYINPVIFH